MRGKWKNVLIALLFILCMVIPSVLSANAEDSTETETSTLEVLDNGVATQSFTSTEVAECRVYDTESGTYTYSGTTPEGYLFAGWYTDKSFEEKYALDSGVTSETLDAALTYYAKFVPSEVLSVKAQVKSTTGFTSVDSNIRMVTTVDSLNYLEVGFDFEFNETTYHYETTEVYKKLWAMGQNGKVLNYTPGNVFHSMSKYFLACTATDIANEDFGHAIKVTPYWITLDGTKVEGVTALKTVNEGYTSSIKSLTTAQYANVTLPLYGASYGAQGGCTDGKYYYQAAISTTWGTVYIQRYDMSTKETKTSDNLSLDHANDITYNEDLSYEGQTGRESGLLVVCHNNPNRTYISFVDPDSLELVAPSKIKITWGDSVTVSDTHIEIQDDIFSIDYNAKRQQYVVGLSYSSFGQDFRVLNVDFSCAGDIHKSESPTSGYATQGVGSDDSYIYFVLYYENPDNISYGHEGHVIAVYDWSGEFETVINIPNDASGISADIEPENISVYNNKIYIACNNGANTTIYQVKSLVAPTVENEVEIWKWVDETGSHTKTGCPTFEDAMLVAEDNDMIVLLQDVEVHSIMDMYANNVTITNADGVNVTIKRASDYVGTIIDNKGKNFTIKSNATNESGTNTLTIDGDNTKGSSWLKSSDENASLILEDITVQKINANKNGGAAYIEAGNLTVNNCKFLNNTNTAQGAALWLASGTTAEITGSTFNTNIASRSGGAIYIQAGADVDVENTDFDGNQGTVGGAINCDGAEELDVIDCNFSNNKATSSTGGAVSVTNGSIATIKCVNEECVFTSNTATTTGGAVHTNNAKLSIEGYKFDSNKSTSTGGAVNIGNGAAYSDTITITGATFTENAAGTVDEEGNVTSSASGGAIYVKGRNLEITKSVFKANSATGQGGAIYNNTNQVTANVCSFGGSNEGDGNYSIAAEGGAIYNAGQGTIVLNGDNSDDSIFEGNKVNASGKWGGAICQGTGKLTVDGYKFKNNTATGQGGAIRISGGEATIENSEFSGNKSTGAQGGAIATLRRLTLANTDFSENKASGNGGAIYTASIHAINVKNCDFNGNASETNGGAIYHDINSDSTTVKLTITCDTETKTTFTGNTAEQGGAVYVNAGNLSISGYKFDGNEAYVEGGAVYLNEIGEEEAALETAATMTFTNTEFMSNKADSTLKVVEETATEEAISVGNGGAIYNNGRDMKVTNCILGATDSGNTAKEYGGAIYNANGGKLTLELEGTDKTVAVFAENSAEKNGGAIYTDASAMSVTGYTFSSNSAYYGGAVYVTSVTDADAEAEIEETTISIVNSAFDSNKANGVTVAEDGTETKAGYGGAIFNAGRNIDITNTDFTKNTANYRAGAICHAGNQKTVKVVDCTFGGSDGNGNSADDRYGAIENRNSAIFELIGTDSSKAVLSYNSAPWGGAIGLGSGTVTVKGYTISNNKATSGEKRAGAFYISGGTFNLTSITNEELSEILQSDVTAENRNVSEILEENTGVNGGAVYLSGGTFNVNGYKIDGNSATSGGVLYLEPTTVANFTDAVVTNNSAAGNGGVVYSKGGTFNAKDCLFGGIDGTTLLGNSATNGGVIYNTAGSKSGTTHIGEISLTNIETTNVSASVEQNSASIGGAIYVDNGKLNVTGYTFSNNSSTNNGGAIYLAAQTSDEQIELGTTIFAGNTAGTKNEDETVATYGNGGAVYNAGRTVKVTGCTFGTTTSGNSATDSGGAIYSSSVTNVEDTNFEHNRANNGAAILQSGSTLTVGVSENNTNEYVFNDNDVTNKGGAIRVNDGTEHQIKGYVFKANDSNSNGGAIYTDSGAGLEIIDCKFGGETKELGNTSKDCGGAIYNAGGSTTTLTSTTTSSYFKNNSATNNGGAIQIGSGTVDVTEYTFTNNSATSGGAIHNNSNVAITIRSSVFSSNSAKTTGGAINSAGGGNTTIYSSYFNDNHVEKNGDGHGGGAIYNGVGGTLKLTVDENSTVTPAFEHNYSSTGDGGAISIGNGALDVTGYTFTGNHAYTTGGAIHKGNNKALTIRDTIFNTNYSETADGGAINIANGVTNIYSSTFTGNHAEASGGAIRSFAGSSNGCNINSSTFNGNYATTGNGGAIYNGNSVPLTLGLEADSEIEALFTGNYTSAGYGGAIGVGSGSLNVTGYNFTGNHAQTTGGAIHNNGSGVITFTSTKFDGNYASGNGGTIYHTKGSLTLKKDSSIEVETLVKGSRTKETPNAQMGGAIYVAAGTVTINDYEFNGNISKGQGGAFWIASDTNVTITDSKFIENKNASASAGAIYTVSTDLDFVRTEFTDNIASTAGGAINCSGGDMTATDCAFSGNISGSSGEGGGAVSITGKSKANFSVTTSGTGKFTGNSVTNSTRGGGAIYTNNANLTVDGYIFNDNSAKTYGGAIYLGSSNSKHTVTNCTFGNEIKNTPHDIYVTSGYTIDDTGSSYTTQNN